MGHVAAAGRTLDWIVFFFFFFFFGIVELDISVVLGVESWVHDERFFIQKEEDAAKISTFL